MEETEKAKTNKNSYSNSKTRYCRGRSTNLNHQHHQQQQQQHSYHNGFFYHNNNPYQTYPPLLPLPTPPPLLHLQFPPATPLLPHNYNNNNNYRSKPTHVQKSYSWKQQMNHLSPPPPLASSSVTQSPPLLTVSQASEAFQKKLSLHTRQNDDVMPISMTVTSTVVAKRPDSGGQDGAVIPFACKSFPS
ncbi:protein argonaute 7-like [Papaver somniferum]|uniref:protein argonaute 7-like n=1 Tax=Papaver somniferum TaxID=3469 RepID=UPI000E6F5F9A|nr:protein argonaute 7-like [Papaver somniferum]